MIDILNYFEEMDEDVYIADAETYDLVYLNEAMRNRYGYQSHEDYSGKKCHDILCGFDVPCPFCKNDQIKDKDWRSCIYTSRKQGKQFLFKTRMFHYGGKRYRIGIFLDVESAVSDGSEHYDEIYDSVVNGCLQEVVSATSAEKSIEQILAYIGTKFLCDRVYIFEFQGSDFLSNTYEWCAEGSVPQKEILQKESIECVDWWMEKFRRNEIVFIEDIEKIKTEHPMTYSTLKPQNISSMAVVPIRINNKIHGFVGVDNPSQSMFHFIHPLLTVIEKVIPLLLKARIIFDSMDRIGFHDPLTDAFNHHAMTDHFADTSAMKSIGVISFDIIGLRQINATLGHKAGDFLIKKCYNHIHNLLENDRIYRIGGDEFLSAYLDCSKADFYKQVKILKENLRTYRYHIACGAAWSNQKPLNVDALIAKADKRRNQNKLEYYNQKYMIQEEELEEYSVPAQLAEANSPEQFMSAISLDMGTFFRSIEENNHSCYFYLGDIQKNLFYISDCLRNDFGFKSSIVPNFLNAWGKFIAIAESRKSYMQKLGSMMDGENSVLDFHCLVRAADGGVMWVQNYGIVTWDEEKGIPLTISGRITHQDNSFVVDPVTNFPQASVFWNELRETQKTIETCNVIGFHFNHITEINHIYGRNYVDRLLNDTAVLLLERLSDKMSFYRLEGIRFIAVIKPECAEKQEILIRQIREIAKDSYHRLGLFFPCPCSVAVLGYSQAEMSIDEFRNNLESLIDIAKHTPEKEYIQSSENCPQMMRKISNLELALNKNVMDGMENFRVVVQPAVSAENETIKGGEVLLRWRCHDEDVSPAVFIPLLEKSNMIHIAGRWVFEQAARICSRVISYYPDFYLSFNISLYQLNDTGFVEFMEKTINKYHLDAFHLVAEITESCLDQQPEMLMLFIQDCKKIGLRLAMDDFGSGYSSLRMMLQYPYNIIKLDRSLLQGITVSDDNQSFIRSLVHTCHYCDKEVCVEGVETAEENLIIRKTGCDTIQGYYHYSPMELNQLYGLISSRES